MLYVLIAYLPSLACIGLAGLLLYKGVDHGWGWLIFAGILLGLKSVTIGKTDDPDKEPMTMKLAVTTSSIRHREGDKLGDGQARLCKVVDGMTVAEGDPFTVYNPYGLTIGAGRPILLARVDGIDVVCDH